MLDQYFIQTCRIVTETRNEWGDYIDQNNTDTIPCRFREINGIERGSHSELNQSDAMLWVSPNSGLTKGAKIVFDGAYYQVDRITKARRLGEDEVQFVKCDLKYMDIDVAAVDEPIEEGMFIGFSYIPLNYSESV